MRSGFYEDVRHCPACRAYVRYLLALDVAYCAECGRQVTLFSAADLAELRRGIAGSGAVRLRRLDESGSGHEAAARSA